MNDQRVEFSIPTLLLGTRSNSIQALIRNEEPRQRSAYLWQAQSLSADSMRGHIAPLTLAVIMNVRRQFLVL